MLFSHILLSLVVSAAVLAPALAIVQSDVDEIKDALRGLIEDWVDDATGGHPFVAGAVRLGFHDCVGGCDGCINPNKPDNAGLDRYIQYMEPTFLKFDTKLSRADFWALAAVTAVEYAHKVADDLSHKNSRAPSVVFRTGRQDCATSPLTTENRKFPDAHHAIGPSLQFFMDEFGFDSKETAALFGAHTLGKCHKDASGFGTSPWVLHHPDALDNRFYRDMMDFQWTAVFHNVGTSDKPNFKWWWQAQGQKINEALMLNSDISLLHDITVNEGGVPTKSHNASDYPDTMTATIVQGYAEDNDAWIRDFSNVYQKVIEHGYDNLKSVRSGRGGTKKSEETKEEEKSEEFEFTWEDYLNYLEQWHRQQQRRHRHSERWSNEDLWSSEEWW